MKTKLKYLTILVLTIAALIFPLLDLHSTEGEAESGEIEEIAARDAFRHLQLQNEDGQIPPNALIDAYKQKEEMQFLPAAWAEFAQGSGTGVVQGSEPGVLQADDPGILEGRGTEEPNVPNPWVPVGPNKVGGRIRSIVIHPTANPRTIWVGAVSGGVWKSTDDGITWTTNTDFLANLGVGCLAIDPANPNILYAGTGEAFRGNGIFKTTDGGDHWQRIVVPSEEHPDFYWVKRLAICPTNSQLILAATSPDDYNGKVYRSTDGGDNWSLTLDFPPYVTIRDVRFQPHEGPADPDAPAINCIAGTSKSAYYSSNGGATWTAATGLPSSPGRVELAYSRSNPSIVYASIGANNGQLYLSIDGGHVFSDPRPTAYPGTGANDYHNSIWVDPTDPDTVVVGGDYMVRTRDHGLNWAEASSMEIHVDHHMIVEDPGYDGVLNKVVYGVNDGGVHRTTNILASDPPFPSVHWTCLNNMGITQFYGAAGHVATGRIVGGTQDNGTVVSPDEDSPNWSTMAGALGGDGGVCAVDQTVNPFFYGEFIFLRIYRSTNGGSTKHYIYNGPNGIPLDCFNHTAPCALAIAPFILDPNDATGQTMLAGGASLWRSTDVRNVGASPSWAEIKHSIGSPQNEQQDISAIAVAPENSNIIWVGHRDGSVYYTSTGTTANPIWLPAFNGLPPSRLCTRIAIAKGPQTDDPLVARTVYVTFSGFHSDNVWKTQNNGGTWTPIHNNLPSAPIYSLVISPSNADALYVGTEVGVFASSNGGAMWSPGNGGPANVPVLDMFWMGSKLVAATHGRSIFTLTIPSPP
jgi:photosystem II stability/assembly factor-like uncharacterized protein